MPPGGVILLIGLAGVAGALVIVVLALVGVSGAQADIQRSLAALDRARPVGGYVAPRDRSLRERVGAPLGARLGGLGRALTPGAAVVRLQRHLDYAGNPPAWPVERVIPAKGVALAVGAVFGGLVGAAFGGGRGAVLGVIGGALLGLFAPDLMVYNLGLKRQQEMVGSLPDILDTLVISVEAGLGFDAAVAQVAQNARGPLAREFVRVLQEMQIGKSRSQSLRALAERTTVPELRTFVTAVVQAGDLGVPIGGVLREQSKEMRLRRRQRAEELAQKVPIKILFPVLFFIFPSLFVVILGPAVLEMIEVFSK
ncbi:type II secretion system F family protein [Pilimelia columellifera]|uniref:Type II secretion system protein GspF domain-containing protein n=1 Tax=Pilimelia columellifera subsp. columellifera TaxID=706583 RepID=A0ABP6B228_9ACTN